VVQVTNIGVLVSGRGSNLQSIIDSINRKEINAKITVVISDVEDAYALERARKHDIPAVFVNPKGKDREKLDEEIAETLREHNADLIVLAGYMRILGKDFVRKHYGRVMNIHPALLPSFPGLHAQKQAFEYGVKVSGCTVHFVDAEVDHGPVIIQKAVPVLEDDTEETLAKRILEEEHKSYPEAIRLYTEGRLKIVGRKVAVRK